MITPQMMKINRDQKMTGSKKHCLLKFSSAQHVLKFCSNRCICCSSRSRSIDQVMGKKSKRRGGGGGSAKASSNGDADQPLVPHEALVQVIAPKSLRGIFSTNDEPTCCAFCHESLSRNYLFMHCCGKVCCRNCTDSIYIFDLRGKDRCALCNTLISKRMAILQSEAKLGKPWAAMFLGTTLAKDGMHNEALTWYARSAMKGNFDAFLQLSDVYRKGSGVSRDLHLAETYARKSRALHSDCGILSNQALRRIAEDYINTGELKKASDILLDIVHEVDENALHGHLCEDVAFNLLHVDHKTASKMFARAFCYGSIEAAAAASFCFFICDKFALSKLWLDVACKTKTLYELSRSVDSRAGRPVSRSWDHYEYGRNDIRSHLRVIRDSCGGCGAALAGERRKYCRCCRTYCYCDEDCQKRHWENGHREECKEVEEYMRKIQTAIRAGKFDWSLEKE